MILLNNRLEDTNRRKNGKKNVDSRLRPNNFSTRLYSAMDILLFLQSFGYY
jgi:hypothetical protein